VVCFLEVIVAMDSGVNGGLTILDENQNVLLCIPNPIIETSRGKIYDINKILEILKEYSNIKIFGVEQSQVFFKDSKKSAFKIGLLDGQITTALMLNKIPFEIIPPKKWMKNIFSDMIIKEGQKASIDYCINKFPNHDFRATLKSKKIHDGMTDSLAIAIYLHRLYMGNKHGIQEDRT
jgi:Holliday junction resolvasome RuvABC endonuclease subunit